MVRNRTLTLLVTCGLCLPLAGASAARAEPEAPALRLVTILADLDVVKHLRPGDRLDPSRVPHRPASSRSPADIKREGNRAGMRYEVDSRQYEGRPEDRRSHPEHGADSGRLSDDEEEFVSECRAKPEARSDLGWGKNRKDWCRVKDLALVLLECGPQPPCNVVTSGSYRETLIGTGSWRRSAREAYFTLLFDDWHVENLLPLNPPVSIAYEFHCAGWVGGEVVADACKEAPERKVQRTLPELYRSNYIGWTVSSPDNVGAAPDLVVEGEFYYKRELIASPPYSGSGPKEVPAQIVRFDSASYLSAQKGSVFPSATPSLRFSISDPAVNESALHIRQAQSAPELTFPSVAGKRVPGVPDSGNWLHRTRDRDKINANDTASTLECENIWGKNGWPGDLQNCDEYPFKTTKEGAHGTKNFSVRVIDKDDNQTAGRRYNVWMGEDRILDGEGFYVAIAD